MRPRLGPPAHHRRRGHAGQRSSPDAALRDPAWLRQPLSPAHPCPPRPRAWQAFHRTRGLARHTEGLIALSGCRPARCRRSSLRDTSARLKTSPAAKAQWFGPHNFFVELQNNLVYGDAPRNHALAEFARAPEARHRRDRRRPLPHPRAAPPPGRPGRDQEPNHPRRFPPRRRENSEYYLKLSRRNGGALRRLSRSGRQHCRASPNAARSTSREDLDYRFPDAPVPDGETPESYLRKTLLRGGRAPIPAAHAGDRRAAGRRVRLVESTVFPASFLSTARFSTLAEDVADELNGRPNHGPPGAAMAPPSARSFAT